MRACCTHLCPTSAYSEKLGRALLSPVRYVLTASCHTSSLNTSSKWILSLHSGFEKLRAATYLFNIEVSSSSVKGILQLYPRKATPRDERNQQHILLPIHFYSKNTTWFPTWPVKTLPGPSLQWLETPSWAWSFSTLELPGEWVWAREGSHGEDSVIGTSHEWEKAGDLSHELPDSGTSTRSPRKSIVTEDRDWGLWSLQASLGGNTWADSSSLTSTRCLFSCYLEMFINRF